ncbi:nucleotide-diphospho-sugar transferase [Xylogone sp. PMI_703]|nr:nucleotide-diphospho-sugar transferase [Xylogone sp. PMI_703]
MTSPDGIVSLTSSILLKAVDVFSRLPSWQLALLLNLSALVAALHSVPIPVREPYLEPASRPVSEPLEQNSAWAIFLLLFAFKSVKIVAHLLSYITYRPAPAENPPSFTPRDVTVIVPTVGSFGAEFRECIRSIMANSPHQIIISTVGRDKLLHANKVGRQLDPSRKIIKIVATNTPNKREQTLHALKRVTTPITSTADDHVFWPATFLRSALAPFEDVCVGIVGTVKRVRREKGTNLTESFLNYLGCIYLERHNFECTASSNIDGGVFVISGRTALMRTQIIQDPEYQKAFTSETWLFGMIGPLKVDDDNFITRWMVNNGWKTVFHNDPDAMIETTIGTTGGWFKFQGQLNRWVRTTWRSNLTSLLCECTCWKAHPWTTYAMFISSFVNMSLFYDFALFLMLFRSGYGEFWFYLATYLFISKMIKSLPHLLRNPSDIIFIIPGILFGYYHSAVKLWALLTAWNVQWTGRQGVNCRSLLTPEADAAAPTVLLFLLVLIGLIYLTISSI